MVKHTAYTYNMYNFPRGAARSFLGPRLLLQGFLTETFQKVLELWVRQACGQAHHSSETNPHVLRRRENEPANL